MIQRIKEYLNKTRTSEPERSAHVRILTCVLTAVAGILLGVLQKWLDSGENVPFLFEQIDLGNYFGRLAIWILLAVVICIYAETPLRASVHTFVFFISMVSSYYLYSKLVLGFLPESYMMIWVVISFISVIPAYFCWYAKGKGALAIIISSVILGVLFSQAFLITQGFYLTHWLEAVTWLVGVAVLLRKPKELILELALSIPAAFIWQLCVPYWG